MATELAEKKFWNSIIEYGLYLLVFLLPWQTRWIIKAGEINGSYWEYGTVSLYGTDILLIMLIIISLVLKLRVTSYELREKRSQEKRFQIPICWYFIAGLELFVFISIFLAPDKLAAGYGYARFMLGAGLFWLAVSASYNRVKLIYAFLAGILLQAGLGIWQFLTQFSFASKWLGMALHDPVILGTSVVETLAGGRWLRAYGGLDHPNMLGGLLVVGILLGLLLLLRNSKSEIRNSPPAIAWHWRAGKQIQNSKFKIQNSSNVYNQYNERIIVKYLLLTACFLLLASLFFTFSRGAWAGLIAGLLIILGLAIIKKDLVGQKKLLEIILAGSVLVFILFNLYGDLVLTRLSQDTRLEVKSSQERVESYGEAWSMIKDNWLLGVGIGNYGIKNNKPSWYFQPAHNVFLLVWAEVGIIGLLFFIAFLFFTSYFLLKKWRANNTYDYKFALLTALFLMLLVDHWWWSLHFGVLLFWLALGLLISRDKQENRIPPA